ncbi:SCO4848 family membrane protein [Nocardioides montaniterrae]
MTIGRKHGWFLVGVAIWSFVIWGRFIKALLDEHAKGTPEPHGYYAAHTVLIIINMILGLVFLVWGVRVLRGSRSA